MLLTLEQRGNDEAITCYSIATGEPEWAVSVPARHETVLGGIGPRSTPTIDDGIVYATGATGWLHAIEGSTGEVLWRKDVVADLGIDRAAHAAAVAWGRAGSPLVTEQLVIVPAGGPRTEFDALEDDADETTLDPKLSRYVSLVAYDRTSGDQKWIAGTEQISYASPQLIRLGDRNAVVTVNEGHVAAYEITLWSINSGNLSGPGIQIPMQAVHSRTFLPVIGFSYRRATALARLCSRFLNQTATGRSSRCGNSRTSSKPSSRTLLSTTAMPTDFRMEFLSAWNSLQGNECGSKDDTDKDSSFVSVQHFSFRLSLEKLSQCRQPRKNLSELSRFPALNGQTWNNLCLSGNNLLVRNAEEAACYEVSHSTSKLHCLKTLHSPTRRGLER